MSMAATGRVRHMHTLKGNGRKPNLKILTGAAVLRLVVENHRVSCVEFVANGRRQQARCERETILSAGAVGSPQILMLSGIGPADELRQIGITSVHDLPGVGRNLHDHLEIDLQWECTEPITVNGL